MADERWSKEKINKWYGGLPYLAGVNFIPSTASNQLEMWQAKTFDPETIDRELGWAEELGMNLVRVYLHDLLWLYDGEGLIDRMERYLDIAGSHGILTSFVFFDDCWNSEFDYGPQPEPEPFTHNSRWLQSPGVGIVNNRSEWGRLEDYVKSILTRFRADDRVLYWDLYNEAGNGAGGDPRTFGRLQGKKSLPLLESVFGWARSVEGLKQPLTSGIWAGGINFRELNRFILKNSDLISFHAYVGPILLKLKIRRLRKHGRPLFCTEYMARPFCTFEKALPVLKRNNVPAVSWGLAAGRSNTVYPWGWKESKGNPRYWFHDIMNADGSMLYERERETIIRNLK